MQAATLQITRARCYMSSPPFKFQRRIGCVPEVSITKIPLQVYRGIRFVMSRDFCCIGLVNLMVDIRCISRAWGYLLPMKCSTFELRRACSWPSALFGNFRNGELTYNVYLCGSLYFNFISKYLNFPAPWYNNNSLYFPIHHNYIFSQSYVYAWKYWCVLSCTLS